MATTIGREILLREVIPKSSPTTTPSSTVLTTITTSPGQPAITQTGTGQTNSRIPGGAAAGIGVGGLVIGALLGLLVAYIFMKRSRKHSSKRRPSSIDTEKHLPVAPIAFSALDETLLDRADDSQLRKSMQDLNEVIDQHVENNYHLQAFVGSRKPLEKGLAEAGYSERSVSEVASLLINQRTRFAAIREVIARILIGNLEARCRPELSLLPPQIVGFVKSIPPVERLGGVDEGMFEILFPFHGDTCLG